MSDGVYAVVLIDGNNLFHKAYSKLRDLTTRVNGEEIVSGGIYGFIRSLKKIRREHLTSNGTIYILFDNCDSKGHQRREVDPDYKMKRRYEKAYYKSLDYLQYLLLNFDKNIVLVYRSKYEADDLVKPLILSLSEYDHILMVSEDRDWARMIEFDGRVIHWFAKSKIYDSETYRNEYGYKPSESSVIMEKTITGDTSDNIPIGVPNIRKKSVLRLIEDFDTVYDMIQGADYVDYLSDLMKSRIKENVPRLRLNFSLVSFAGVTKEELNSFSYECRFNPATLETLYKILNFDIPKIDKRIKTDSKKKSLAFQPYRLKRG